MLGDIDRPEFSVGKRTSELGSVDRIGFYASLLIGGRNVRRVDDHIIDAVLHEGLMRAKTKIAGLIDRMVLCPGNVRLRYCARVVGSGGMDKRL
jgi:hypothetical protein